MEEKEAVIKGINLTVCFNKKPDSFQKLSGLILNIANWPLKKLPLMTIPLLVGPSSSGML